MILGVGIDLVDVARIRDAVGRLGEPFLNRILTPAEVEYCRRHRDPAPFYAARFAAKEAVAKAFGTGFGSDVGWLEVEVEREPSGQPRIALHGAAAALFTRRGARVIHVSLSHTDTQATAVAILEA